MSSDINPNYALTGKRFSDMVLSSIHSLSCCCLPGFAQHVVRFFGYKSDEENPLKANYSIIFISWVLFVSA
jgi:hypothetical protein